MPLKSISPALLRYVVDRCHADALRKHVNALSTENEKLEKSVSELGDDNNLHQESSSQTDFYITPHLDTLKMSENRITHTERACVAAFWSMFSTLSVKSFDIQSNLISDTKDIGLDDKLHLKLQNYIHDIPYEPTLLNLNLSKNRLERVEHLVGLAQNASLVFAKLQTLDLSHNQLGLYLSLSLSLAFSLKEQHGTIGLGGTSSPRLLEGLKTAAEGSLTEPEPMKKADVENEKQTFLENLVEIINSFANLSSICLEGNPFVTWFPTRAHYRLFFQERCSTLVQLDGETFLTPKKGHSESTATETKGSGIAILKDREMQTKKEDVSERTTEVLPNAIMHDRAVTEIPSVSPLVQRDHQKTVQDHQSSDEEVLALKATLQRIERERDSALLERDTALLELEQCKKRLETSDAAKVKMITSPKDNGQLLPSSKLLALQKQYNILQSDYENLQRLNLALEAKSEEIMAQLHSARTEVRMITKERDDATDGKERMERAMEKLKKEMTVMKQRQQRRQKKEVTWKKLEGNYESKSKDRTQVQDVVGFFSEGEQVREKENEEEKREREKEMRVLRDHNEALERLLKIQEVATRTGASHSKLLSTKENDGSIINEEGASTNSVSLLRAWRKEVFRLLLLRNREVRSIQRLESTKSSLFSRLKIEKEKVIFLESEVKNLKNDLHAARLTLKRKHHQEKSRELGKQQLRASLVQLATHADVLMKSFWIKIQAQLSATKNANTHLSRHSKMSQGMSQEEYHRQQMLNNPSLEDRLRALSERVNLLTTQWRIGVVKRRQKERSMINLELEKRSLQKTCKELQKECRETEKIITNLKAKGTQDKASMEKFQSELRKVRDEVRELRRERNGLLRVFRSEQATLSEPPTQSNFKRSASGLLRHRSNGSNSLKSKNDDDTTGTVNNLGTNSSDGSKQIEEATVQMIGLGKKINTIDGGNLTGKTIKEKKSHVSLMLQKRWGKKRQSPRRLDTKENEKEEAEKDLQRLPGTPASLTSLRDAYKKAKEKAKIFE
eukprot:g1356.t1